MHQQAIRRLMIAMGVCLWAAAAMGQPRNVVLLIGDGMGFEQLKAASLYASGTTGALSFETFAYQGAVTTYSANSAVTDSAAAATAIATGVKVNNDVLSMATPGDGRELQTMLEYFQVHGKATGMVTTTYITHATPAAFGAHEASRNNLDAIGQDYVSQTRPTVLFGGGGNGMPDAPQGYAVVTDRSSLLAYDSNSPGRLSGQFGTGFMPFEADGMGSLPHLSEMASKALDILDNDPDGLFLMVEGGLIDTAAHANDIKRCIGETVEFSNTVAAVLTWAAGRTDTLVLVTADHETGGLSVVNGNGAGNLPTVTWRTGLHTAANVPIYAWGANARLVSPLMDNTDLFALVTRDDPLLPGDADANNLVDQRDFKAWFDNNGIGQVWEQGNFKGYGATDMQDYKLWFDHNGMAASAPVAGLSVPEPMSVMLLSAGAMLFIPKLRWRCAARRLL